MRTSGFVCSILLLSQALLTSHAFAQLPATPPSHIVILIEENYAYSDIIGSSYAPNINALATNAHSALFTQSYAIEHPSEPNYLDFFSGNNQGTTGSDGLPAGYPFTTANLAAQLIAASKTFITYSEDLPAPGSDIQTYTSGGANYARKHNPCANWMGTGTNQYSGIVVNLPYIGYFPNASNYSSLPTVCYLVPNMTNDMHDGTYPTNITIGDTWYKNHLDSFLTWALANNTLLIVTFDEDDDLHGNNIPTIFYGPMVKGGTYSENITHYSVLRTIEALYGLPYAGSAATATTITDCWIAPSGVLNNTSPDYSFKVSPNPAYGVVNFSCSNQFNTHFNIIISDELGKIVGKYTMNGNQMPVNTGDYAPGTYFYKAIDDHNNIAGQGKFIINNN